MNIQEYTNDIAYSLSSKRNDPNFEQMRTFTNALAEEGFTVDERHIYFLGENTLCRINLSLKVGNTVKLYRLNVSYRGDGDTRIWNVYSAVEYTAIPVFRAFNKILSEAICSIVGQIVDKEFPEND